MKTYNRMDVLLIVKVQPKDYYEYISIFERPPSYFAAGLKPGLRLALDPAPIGSYKTFTAAVVRVPRTNTLKYNSPISRYDFLLYLSILPPLHKLINCSWFRLVETRTGALEVDRNKKRPFSKPFC